ncbi:hypothetical protein G9A89_001196 [Geosiphon pyriformis]|nr:hypothetical protein G9A89_001196 [Geosiphon pyriformis]
MKKALKNSSSDTGIKSVVFRKKKRGSVLKDSSDSVNMKEKCLVEETSFDYDESVQTKRVLEKPLEKINFLVDNNDNILLDALLILFSSMKILVDVPVRKLFALDIGLNKVVGKFSQEKLMAVRKLFSKVNAIFTSKLSLAQASNMIKNVKILVNTDLKKSSEHSDWAVTVVEFEQLKHADLVIAKLFILIGKDTVHVAKADMNKVSWDKDKSRLATIYVKYLVSVAYSVFFGDVSWTKVVGRLSFPPFSAGNGLSSFGFSLEVKPTLMISLELNNKFAALKHSLVSLVKCVDILTKRLDASGLTVFQLSPKCQLLVTFLSQNQKVNIVISESSDVVTGGETVAGIMVFDKSVISKLEVTLKNLSITVMGLMAKVDNAGLVYVAHSSQ